MAESSDFNLILTDFLKYVPEPKRHDYELMLRRCNFSDPADPMFPVMLFLLFFQDNLADRMEELTEEVTRRENESPAAQIPVVVPERKSGWKIGIAVLLAVQLLLIVFGVFCLITRELPPQIKSDSAISHSSEIRRINRYWDEKLQYARKGDFCMKQTCWILSALLGISAVWLGGYEKPDYQGLNWKDSKKKTRNCDWR